MRARIGCVVADRNVRCRSERGEVELCVFAAVSEPGNECEVNLSELREKAHARARRERAEVAEDMRLPVRGESLRERCFGVNEGHAVSVIGLLTARVVAAG